MISKTFIFTGISGSGKGTQIALLKEYMRRHEPEAGEYSFVMGDTLRSFMKNPGYAQEFIRSIVNKGDLVPDFVSSSLFVSSVLETLHEKDTFYIDGIPRSPYQADVIISLMSFYNRTKVYIINISVSEQEVERRMLLRNRPDDSKKSIKNRIDFYNQNVIPGIEHLKEKSGFNYFSVDGERSIEEIHQDIIAYLKSSF